MNTRAKYLLALLMIHPVMDVHAATPNDIYADLSDFQHFRVYPYVDKAFEREQNKQYLQALDEIDQAMAIVPDHVPFIKYAYTLSLLANKPNSELEALLKQIPASERGDLLLELRQKESQAGELYSPHEVSILTKGMTEKQIKRWFMNHVYTIERVKGKGDALQWSISQPIRYKSIDALRFEAYASYESKQFPQAISILEGFRAKQLETEQDLRFLSYMYLELGQYGKALALTKDKQGEALYEDVQTAYISHLIYENKLVTAKSALEELAKRSELNSEQQHTFDYLNSFNALQLSRLEKERMVMNDCLKEVITLADSGKRELAVKQFSSCNPNLNSSSWLIMAESLGAYRNLQAARFKTPRLESQRRQILANHYKAKGNWQGVSELFAEPTNTAQRLELANAYRHLGDDFNASKAYFDVYRHTKKIKYLDRSTYLLQQAIVDEEKQASELAEQLNVGMHNTPQRFFANKQLLNRVAEAVLQRPELFQPNDIARLNMHLAKKAQINAAIWQQADACNVLEKHFATDAFSRKAEAHCYGESSPLVAASMYEQAVADQESISNAEHLQLATWYAQGQQHTKAQSHWQMADNLSSYDHYLYADSLYQSGQYQEANQVWQDAGINSDNAQWWLLGVKIAEQLDNSELLSNRYQRALAQSQSGEIAAEVANYYLETEPTQLPTYVNDVIKSDNSGHISAQLGYLLSHSHPTLAVQLLEKAHEFPAYRDDVNLMSEYARLSADNGQRVKALTLYEAGIDELNARPETEKDIAQKHYLQRAHRDVEQGWQFAISGWAGDSSGRVAPGYTGQTGNYFVMEEAKYYFDQPWVPGLAFSATALHSGLLEQDQSWFNSQVDIGLQLQPIKNWSYYLKAGVVQDVWNDNRDLDTRGYVRFSADVFSKDDWSKAWQADRDMWLYHAAYVDATKYLDEEKDYFLFARYNLGETFKVSENHRQRVTPYGFGQWSSIKNTDSPDKDKRLGLGVSWTWEWFNSAYDGYSVVSEVGLEWQHINESNTLEGHGDSYLLRFSSSF